VVKTEEEQKTPLPKDKGQRIIYKTLHRKLKIEQHDLTNMEYISQLTRFSKACGCL
jgi:hypothetical protein